MGENCLQSWVKNQGVFTGITLPLYVESAASFQRTMLESRTAAAVITTIPHDKIANRTTGGAAENVSQDKLYWRYRKHVSPYSSSSSACSS